MLVITVLFFPFSFFLKREEGRGQLPSTSMDLESEEQPTVEEILLLRVLLSTVNSCSTFQSCGWWCTKGKGKVNRCWGLAVKLFHTFPFTPLNRYDLERREHCGWRKRLTASSSTKCSLRKSSPGAQETEDKYAPGKSSSTGIMSWQEEAKRMLNLASSQLLLFL